MAKKRFNPNHDGDRYDWYTPPHIVAFAYAVLGGIALDPASSAEANEVVKADRFFTEADNGLKLDWLVPPGQGGVFVNPPYGRGNVVGKWWAKMLAEFDAGHFDHGLMLVNAKTETAYFQEMLSRCPVLLIRSRLRFWLPAHAPDNARDSGYFGSALVLLSRPLNTSGLDSDALNTPLVGPLIRLSSGAHAPLISPVLRRFLALGRDLGHVVTSMSAG
jgi:hypothetical protein